MRLVELLAEWIEREVPAFVAVPESDLEWAPEGLPVITPVEARKAARSLLSFLSERGLAIGPRTASTGSGPGAGTAA